MTKFNPKFNLGDYVTCRRYEKAFSSDVVGIHYDFDGYSYELRDYGVQFRYGEEELEFKQKEYK